MSTPEIPMIAVKSAYSIKSCPLSSEMNRTADTEASRDTLNVKTVSLAVPDEDLDEGEQARPRPTID